ncbi:protein NYNRIN-like [Eriocheir sinensis]|uniref:protein NYNRIN-like n=1 Tax=Eriocheir sinensis TaxID=95602 RepID=UPI0021CA7331|nr:protein NYNRIN-like [Eriocheir sinensis]
MLHITDKDETALLKAAQIADVFSLVHRPTFSGEKKTQPVVKSGASNQKDGRPVDIDSKSSIFCSFCKKTGHLIKNCPDPTCKVAKVGTFSKPVASLNTSDSLPVDDPFKPFRSQGTVSLNTDSEERPIQIMRDTASTQSIPLISPLPGVERKYTGEKVFLKDFHQTFPVPLSKVHLNCPLVRGTVTVAVSDDKSLPIPHANFLLANDLAGELVIPPLITNNPPLSYNPTADMEKEQPHLFPSCAVTRAQTRATAQMPLQPLPTITPHTANVNLGKVFSEQLLAEAQREDVTLSRFHGQVIPNDQITHSPSFYYQDKVLMRLFKPPKLPDDATWAEIHQIVLPVNLREPVIEIAHGKFAGHLGIRKTCDKLLNDFYWPGQRKDVTAMINSCHTCQVMEKPNQSIPQYPLQTIQVPEEPFHKIIIDIVGPLPQTRKGNKYILTVMCPTTRYPEAFPLRNITAKTIVTKLTQLFTTFGIPREIQSDRGTNFTSDLFAAVLAELGINQTLSTAYHPQSQGALERCHQTLKALLRKFCHDQDQEWDEALPFVLFAIRETPNESLGVSPFELLFGHKVRGPLKIIKDQLLSDTTCKLVTITKYIEKLKNTFDKVRSFARSNLKLAQGVMKEHFDIKAKVRTFNEGDQVLAFIPVSGSPLQAKYHGPYTINKKISDNN